MWFNESVFYQIYTLGFCGAPLVNDEVETPRIKKIADWIPHLQKLGVNALLLNPIFESDSHGYDTRDYGRLDSRLGSNEDFEEVSKALHQAGIRLVLDGVFNHVGRGFWAFKDVQQRRWESPYKDWFHISFDGNSNYDDGFWYEGWEGHFELVKLNLRNPSVVDYLLGVVGEWIDRFDLDGLRLDVAYMVDRDFLKALHSYCLSKKPDFFLLGEMIHGDYKVIVNGEMCHSATNYECAKGIVSAFNSMNLFEIGHSLHRQFSNEPWALYTGMPLLSFADNHDISRVATQLKDGRNLIPLHVLLFGMPGIPCVYYGSEWGAPGDKTHGDAALRPSFDAPEWTDLTDVLARLSLIRRQHKALAYGGFHIVHMTNRQLIIQRQFEDERILIAINADDAPATVHFDAGCGQADELISGKLHDFGGGSELPPHSGQIWLMER